MNSLFTFSFANRLEASQSEQVIVIFAFRDVISAGEIIDKAKRQIESAGNPDRIVLLVPKIAVARIEEIIEKEGLVERLPVRSENTRLDVLVFDERGVLWRLNGLEKEEIEFSETSFCESLRSEGLLRIFQDRGIERAPAGFHFIKPSGKHSDRFVRIGRILTRSSEIYFIAFCLMGFLKSRSYDQIYCDTSEISIVVHAALMLKRFGGENSGTMPIIDSFGGYEGLRTFALDHAANCLFVISSSTTGDLERRLRQKFGLRAEQVITLFFLGESKGHRRVLCDLARERDTQGNRYGPITNISGDRCDWCAQNSVPIRLSGDHMLPGGTLVEDISVTKDHAPSWFAGFLKEFIGQKAFRCNWRYNLTGEIREVFVDMSSAFKAPGGFSDFRARLKKMLIQGIPASLSRIVHLDDEASVELAKFVREVFRECAGGQGREVEMVSMKELSRNRPRPLLSKIGSVKNVAIDPSVRLRVS